jgi:uncharacterized protein
MSAPAAAPLSLAAYQHAMGQHLRNPPGCAPPAGQDTRRTQVYSTLVHANIESAIARTLPICKAVLGRRWPKLIAAFWREARSHTPFFHELGGEFVQWLLQSPPDLKLPPWLLSLAHYEWIELAVEVKPTEAPTAWADPDTSAWSGDAPVRLNPTLESLAYEWPVHRIGPGYKPRKPQPTWLLVFRDQAERVRFHQVNAPTMRLVALLQAGAATPMQACQQVALEMGRPLDPALLGAGMEQITALLKAQALCPA